MVFCAQHKNKSIILLVRQKKQNKQKRNNKAQALPLNTAEKFCHSFSRKAEGNEKRRTSGD